MQADQHRFEDLTRGLHSKSDKIRTLARAGAATGDIARFLGIRYQFARNVLVAADLHHPRQPQERAEEKKTPEPRQDEWIAVAGDGSLTLPASWLRQLGVEPGQSLLVTATADAIELLPQATAVARAQSILRRFVPGQDSLVDELIADRRAEAHA